MSEIRQVLAVAEMFPDGQRCSAAVVEYDTAVCNAAGLKDCFSVEGRTVLWAEVRESLDGNEPCDRGCYIYLGLETDSPQADVVIDPPREPGKKGPPPPKYRRPPAVSVTQTAPVQMAAGGEILPDGVGRSSSRALEPVVEDFQSLMFDGLRYYLYVPKDYDPTKRYPLVLFMTDMGANSDDEWMALSQGIGGTIWATPEEQAKHPCFVLVPQFPFTRVVGDEFQCSPIYYKVKPLLDSVIARYSVDMDRIYLTGQSQGCMASCQLNVEYPDFFAASLLIAGQWNPATMGPACAKHQYWIIVSELDTRAFPGMNAVTDALAEHGAVVKKSVWDAKLPAPELAKRIEAARSEEANIRYTCLSGDSVLPDSDNGPERLHHVHSATWKVAYTFEGVRDWLFSCRKD